jgi:hypothetical protein
VTIYPGLPRTRLVYNWVWWYTLVILALGRLRQDDLEMVASLGYIMRDPSKKKKNTDYICY